MLEFNGNRIELLAAEEKILIKNKARQDSQSYNMKNKGLGQDPEIARRVNLGKKIPRHIVEKTRKALIEGGKVKEVNNARARKVIRLDTEEIFDYARVAAVSVGGTDPGISEACVKGYKHRDIHWMFHHEWLELGKPLENPRYAISGKARWRVVRLSDGEIFETASQAAREYNIHNMSIHLTLDNQNLSAGGHHWMRYLDWKEQGEPIKILSELHPNNKYGKIVDMATRKKYLSTIECAKYTDYSDATISKHVNGLIKNRRFISEKEWKEKGEPLIEKYTQTHQPKKVINTKTGEMFNTIKEAAKSLEGSTPGLSTAIKNKRKYKGVIFEPCL